MRGWQELSHWRLPTDVVPPLRSVLVSSLLVLAETALAAPPMTLRFRDWYPGFLPGSFGRTTLTVESDAKGPATFELTFEKPPDDQRKRFDPTEWTLLAESTVRLEGTWRARPGGGFSWRFEGQGIARPIELVCTPAERPVHPAKATVTPNPVCSPCYDPGPCPPTWQPKTVRRRRGLACRLVNAAPTEPDAPPPRLPKPHRLPEELFLVELPGVEQVTGASDCPPTGLREVP